MEEIYLNVEYEKTVHSRSSGPRSSENIFYRAAVVCLGLLSVFLLIGLIILGVHYHNSVRGAATEPSTIKANKTESVQDREKELSFLTAEKDQLKSKLSSVTREKDQLNATLIEMTKQRNRLKSLSRKSPAGWTLFSGSFYLLSTESGSWTNATEDCQRKGADLVVIESLKEQEFLSEFTNESAWIGLSDRDEEGTWKWIDGTTMTFGYWGEDEPNNSVAHSNDGEDCAEIRVQIDHKWNDKPCDLSVRWICEIKV
ncbi:hypothetical protein Q5P01_013915 [Channa striata]|uniref:C-type lectin domain-containing protein n=1 Tax=Channa striata TaxID=64152 RepID=A0AA88MN95_CHASR|nr:hypothetical protein Q5P01_013915 [Channa striata]